MLQATDTPVLNRPDLLQEVFSLLQQVETGTLKPQDFDKNTGSIRLALNSIRQAVQESEGINESVADRQDRINALQMCNEKRASFLVDLRQRVLADLQG